MDYLWFGIGAYLKNNPNIKYMFGPVSMSASFPTVAKDMMIFYYSHYYGDQQNLVEAKVPYSYSNNLSEIKEIFDLNDKKKDFKFLKSTLANIGVSIPTLYKQYSDIAEDKGVKFLGFNVDNSFGDCIDGFILVEVAKIKDSARQRYIENN